MAKTAVLRYRKNIRTAAVLLAFALIAVFLGEKLWPVVRVALISLFFAFLLKPAKTRLERYFPKTVSAAVCFFVLLSGVAGIVLLILIPALSEMKRLPLYLEKGIGSLESVIGEFGGRFRIGEILKSAVQPDAQSIYKTVLTGAGNVASFFVNLMAVIALTWFLLSDWEQISLRLILFVPSHFRVRTLNALSAIRRDLGGYLRAQGAIIALVSLMAITALVIIGTPIPLAMGLMYGLLNAIPYFGPLIGLLPPVLSAMSVSLKSAMLTMGALLLIQQIDNYALSPRVMGEVSGAGPAFVLIAVAAGNAVGGVTGMFLALPLLIAAKAVYRAFTAPSY